MLPSCFNKPYVIPIFIPHMGCPHRCVFCNQKQTTGQAEHIPTASELHQAITRFLSYRRDSHRYTEISFFGGNFLGLQPDQIHFFLSLGANYVARGAVNGLRFSTRPDTITATALEIIADFPITTIEIGVQSMNEKVLSMARRGHSAQDTCRAVAKLHAKAYRLGLQMMVGLPGDTPQQALHTAKQIAALQPDFVRIYPTLVLEGSLLAHWYAQGQYTPLTLNESVDLVKALLTFFTDKKITVIRMGLQPTTDLNPNAGVLAGPFHSAFGELVHAALWYCALKNCFANQQLEGQVIEIATHPTMVSRLIGYKRKNFRALQHKFQLTDIKSRPTPELPSDIIIINGQRYRLHGDRLSSLKSTHR
jgi:histone acetyltransferase (RNA polymerase elongator complex component)